jgi:hypothetical protein
MATHIASYGELMAMPIDELRREVLQQRAIVRKMHLSIQLNKEKDTAKYRREKRALARMLTAFGSLSKKPAKAKTTKELKSKPKSRTLSAPSVS